MKTCSPRRIFVSEWSYIKFQDGFIVSLSDMDVCTVIKACNFAAERHRLQRRKDAVQTPYINHPIGKLIVLFVAAI